MVVRNPAAFMKQGGFDDRALTSLSKAARLQTFIDVLDEVSREEYKITIAEVTIT